MGMRSECQLRSVRAGGLTSDYGSGSSMNSSTSWGSQELDWQTFQSQLLNRPSEKRPKAASFADLVSGRCTLDDVMQEFRMNGSDAPYNPDEESVWMNKAISGTMSHVQRIQFLRHLEWIQYLVSTSKDEELTKVNKQLDTSPTESSGNASYMRQSSWPATAGELPPAPRRPRSLHVPLAEPEEVCQLSPPTTALPEDELTEEQRRVLSSLSDVAVVALLRHMQRRNKRQPEECRFCKNNGERESYYRSHALKDASGAVRCPVLRAFVCRRCGASGDAAHTIKYCPLSTNEERMKSAAMMRSVRLASGRRRALAPSVRAREHCAPPGASPPPAAGAAARGQVAPLDPSWAALEQKLMLLKRSL